MCTFVRNQNAENEAKPKVNHDNDLQHVSHYNLRPYTHPAWPNPIWSDLTENRVLNIKYDFRKLY